MHIYTCTLHVYIYTHIFTYLRVHTCRRAYMHTTESSYSCFCMPLTNGVWSMDKAIHAVVEFIASPSIECVLPVAAAMICYCPPSTVACHLALRVI